VPRILAAGFSLLLLACSPGRETIDPRPAGLPPEGLQWGAGLPSAPAPADSLRVVLAALTGASASGQAAAELRFHYPRSGVIFPPEFIPPTFTWRDSISDFWLVTFRSENGDTFHVFTRSPPGPPPRIDSQVIPAGYPMEIPDPGRHRHWTPPEAIWETMKKASAGNWAELRVTGFLGRGPLLPSARGSIRFKTSRDSVGAPIFYRDVPLMPNRNKSGRIQPLDENAMRHIRWTLRDVSLREGKTLIPSLPTCANCHSFSRDGRYMGMDLDGPQNDKGTYGLSRLEPETDIAHDDVFSWNGRFPGKARKSTIGFLSRVSPDGQYVATTVNEEVVVHNYLNTRYIQVFFPTRGVLAYYSREARAIRLLPGADDTAFVHCNPVWSPDGKYLVFSRARAKDPYAYGQSAPDSPNDPNETQIQYDLYRIPFNRGRGGRPEAVAGASGNGMSNTFPAISPDGKFIVFVKCRNGQLLRPDGKLWMVPFEGGEARLMDCNLDEMNSWHSFSPNGRWMVFASKGFTPYTQLFLTHIDPDGSDSPPVLIPDATAANRAANLPEFVNYAYDRWKSVKVSALEHMQYLKDATRLLERNETAAAREKLQQALGVKTRDAPFRSEVRVLLAWLQESSADRIRMTREAIRLDPGSVQARLNLATLLDKEGKDREALAAYQATVDLDPGNPWPVVAMARIYMHSQAPGVRDYAKAEQAAEKANRIAKFREPSILKTLARAYSETGKFREAEAAARRGLELARQMGLRSEAEELLNEIPIYVDNRSFSWALKMQGPR
jgi:hypothetical protein